MKALIKYLCSSICIIFLSNLIYSQSIDENNLDGIIENLSIEDANALLSLSGASTSGLEDSNSSLAQSTVKEIEIEKSEIFGIDFIKTTPTTISATSDLPVPKDYILSINDQIKVILSGTKKAIYNLTIGLDGSILFPEIGSIQVSGDTYNQAKKKISNLVEATYVGVYVDISLGELSAKKISIVGAVKNPGTFIVNPYTTISNSLVYSGGAEEYASLRRIELIRANGEKKYFDLYKILIDGDRSDDYVLQSGDTVRVLGTTNFIRIDGEVLRPMTYEFLEGENIEKIVGFSMGFTKEARKDSIFLTTYQNDLNSFITEEVNIRDKRNLDNVSSISVFRKGISRALEISVEGPVENPGFFSSKEFRNLEQLIDSLTFSNDVYPYAAVVSNNSVDETKRYSKVFSIVDSETQKVEIGINTKIQFFSVNEILRFSESRDMQNFEMLDQLSKTALEKSVLTVNYRGSSSFLPLAGVVNARDIANLLGLEDMIRENNKVIYINSLLDQSLISTVEELSFNPAELSILSFFSSVPKTINVSVTGNVKYPGIYQVQSNISLQDIYQYVGGFTDQADEDSIVFIREDLRQQQIKQLEKAQSDLSELYLSKAASSDNSNAQLLKLLNKEIDKDNLGRISGDFSMNSPEALKFLVKDGDEIFIPSKISTVSIIGEVLSPNTIIHEPNNGLKFYIENAGGYSKFSDRRGIYVIRANGKIQRFGNNIFTRNIEILPGDTIVVPSRVVADDSLVDVLAPITAIISNLAFASASLDQLKN